MFPSPVALRFERLSILSRPVCHATELYCKYSQSVIVDSLIPLNFVRPDSGKQGSFHQKEFFKAPNTAYLGYLK